MKTKYFENNKRDRQHDEAIITFLKSDRYNSFTYNQIAAAIGINTETERDKVTAVMFALQSESLRQAGIIDYYPYARKPKHNKSKLRLFKYAPERQEMDARLAANDKQAADSLVCRLLLGLLKRDGPSSERRIYERMRQRLGHISEEIIDRCLALLRAKGRVDVEIKDTRPYRKEHFLTGK